VSPIQAFTFTKLCIALKNMDTSSWVANIVDGWDWVKECIYWCVPVFREAICIMINISTLFIDRSTNHTPLNLLSLLSRWNILHIIIDYR
jgi:hypothetical protein